MSNPFFDHPILNSPYQIPTRHWELDEEGQPTQALIPKRRPAKFITPIPKPKKRRKRADADANLLLGEGEGHSTRKQQYDLTSIINSVRRDVDLWRAAKDPAHWRVTPETARLLQHWRHHEFSNQRPFFCQVEAAETAIWLTEVAPFSADGRQVLKHLADANEEANPGLNRLALKLATGAGKTTVMAMLIAWQTVNAVRRPGSKMFSRGFLICTPGLTIKDRLRVLEPNDPDNYYARREIVPQEMLPDIRKATVVITNYHAFKLRERLEVSAGGRALLKGRTGEDLITAETAGQMMQRVMAPLMGLKNIVVLNDEAHHCYREKPAAADDAALTGDDRDEAEENNKAARLWIGGIETVARTIGVTRVFDLSATPFFLRGSGYDEGTLFPWTLSDFSLMDAIECGIVKLPRVPIAENLPGNDLPVNRDLWNHIRDDMPKKGRGKNAELDPLKLPAKLQTALEQLYGHYQAVFHSWQKQGIKVPPCFIVVCQNTAISKLIYDYISGFHRTEADGSQRLENGRLELFRNYDPKTNEPYPRPRTLLIDSEQLESGNTLDDNFRKLNAAEIERFRREIIERTRDAHAADKLSDAELLREAMNTVGKPDTLGGSIRCVVSVSMLTEGWDANTVTHVLGVRAFGTQLLCEQVIGRALRRREYELNAEGLFEPDYADVFGIPFDFTAKPVAVKPKPPKPTVLVKAVRPDRDSLEIRFPRVEGYRAELPRDRLSAKFTADSILTLTPDLIGPSVTQNAGIVGQTVELDLKHRDAVRTAEIAYHLAKRLVFTKFRDAGAEPKLHLFGQLKAISEQWIKECVVPKARIPLAFLLYGDLQEMACNRITAAITASLEGTRPIEAVLNPYNPTGSTNDVRFNTSAEDRWETDARRCHVNLVVLDSDWEAEFCRVAESHPRVLAYVKNHGLGFEVPYRHGAETRRYRPDFIVLVDDGHGPENPLRMIVEIKGFRGEDAKEKKATMDTYWIPGINQLGSHGRWAFAEFCDIYEIESEFKTQVAERFDAMIETAVTGKSQQRA